MEQHLAVECAKCGRIAEVSCVGCGAHVRPLPAEADTSATVILGEWAKGVPDTDGDYYARLPHWPEGTAELWERLHDVWHGCHDGGFTDAEWVTRCTSEPWVFCPIPPAPTQQASQAGVPHE